MLKTTKKKAIEELIESGNSLCEKSHFKCWSFYGLIGMHAAVEMIRQQINMVAATPSGK